MESPVAIIWRVTPAGIAGAAATAGAVDVPGVTVVDCERQAETVRTTQATIILRNEFVRVIVGAVRVGWLHSRTPYRRWRYDALCRRRNALSSTSTAVKPRWPITRCRAFAPWDRLDTDPR